MMFEWSILFAVVGLWVFLGMYLYKILCERNTEVNVNLNEDMESVIDEFRTVLQTWADLQNRGEEEEEEDCPAEEDSSSGGKTRAGQNWKATGPALTSIASRITGAAERILGKTMSDKLAEHHYYEGQRSPWVLQWQVQGVIGICFRITCTELNVAVSVKLGTPYTDKLTTVISNLNNPRLTQSSDSAGSRGSIFYTKVVLSEGAGMGLGGGGNLGDIFRCLRFIAIEYEQLKNRSRIEAMRETERTGQDHSERTEEAVPEPDKSVVDFIKELEAEEGGLYDEHGSGGSFL